VTDGSGESGERVLLLGFDALDFRYLDAFRDSTPNLARLRDRGVAAPLRSTLPPWTGSAWPSMYTGMDPSHHGVYSFYRYDGYPEDGELVSRSDVDAPALWNYASSEELASVVLNVPVTHPAEPVEGVLVPGYTAPEDEPGYPRGIRDELGEAIGEPYRIYARTEFSDDGDEKLRGYLDLLDRRRRAAVELLSNRDWRLAVVQVQKTDAVFHNFDDSEAHRRVYAAADDLVGSVLDAVGDDVNVLVCSDHGMGRADGYRIFLNEVLRSHGYVEATDGPERPLFSATKPELVGADGDGTKKSDGAGSPSVGERLLARAAGALADVGVTPDRAYAAAERLGLESVLLDAAPASVRESAARTVDWRSSAAYCREGTRLGVRVNLQGREPDGVVPPDEYESVRADLVALLSGLETPDGEPAFETVARREAVYDGPHADRAPDVIAVPAGMKHGISTRLYGTAFVPLDRYDHQRDGVFVAAGPAVRDGFDADRLSLTDVAPVAMALLGLPVPARTTGSVPDGLLDRRVREREYRGVADGVENRDTDDGRVTERLEDLGYL
jgi:predicted AlkP superfamily phosphohydrolase/phosphomutase